MNLPPVLYVEDDEDDVFFMRRGFKIAGLSHPLEIAGNGQEAIDYLAGNGRFSDRTRFPLPCLVLLDLNMPVRSGFEVLFWLRRQARFEKLPVIVFTASSRRLDRETDEHLGANEFITKPNDMSQLSPLLQEINARWLSPP